MKWLPPASALLNLAIFSYGASASASTLVVDLGGTGNFSAIQPAIDAAQPGDTVLLKAGEYEITESIRFKGKAITVRSESGPEATTIRMSEAVVVQDASVVSFENEETPAAVLDGITIRGATGFGIKCYSSPTLKNCTMTGNWGGGVECYAASPTLTDCTISGNSGLSGVYCYSFSSPTLTNCAISGNLGDGVNCGGESSPTLTGCTISGNSGNGANCESSPTMTNCTITGNSINGVLCEFSNPALTNCKISENSGDGVRCDFSSTTLAGCTISRNSGGGLVCTNDSSPMLTDCIILGNSTSGVRSGPSHPILNRCTISKNWGGGVRCDASGAPTLNNCIVWDNIGDPIVKDDGSRPSVSYSCIESNDVWPGSGNTNADPQFCGWEGGEVWVDASRPNPGTGTQGEPYSQLGQAISTYRLSLKAGSPCLGTGEGGSDMGAAIGTCDGVVSGSRVVHLGPGTYLIDGHDLIHRVSIEGAGQEATVIEGTVYRLRTGAVLSNLKVTGGMNGGVVVENGDAPEIRECAISGNSTSGISCLGASPKLTHCTISENAISGVFCVDSASPTLTGCDISGNSGHGVICENSSPTLNDCTISGNASSGVSCIEASPSLIRCTISENLTGGLECSKFSSPTLTSCTISGNSASSGGGAVYSFSSSPTLMNCTISWNHGEGVYSQRSSLTLTSCKILRNSGGGVTCDGFPSPTLTNCFISGNSGKGVSCYFDLTTLTNCTITENLGFGLLSHLFSHPNLLNCTIWDNSGPAISIEPESNPNVSYSCIESSAVWPGAGNINSDPQFCGWETNEVWVDASRPGPGTGTKADPYSQLSLALGTYSSSFKSGSPCLGAGEGGADMGAALGECGRGGFGTRVVRLAPGTYPIEGYSLTHHASMEGSGQETTIIEGTAYGLRTGAFLSGLVLTKGRFGGLLVFPGESPEIRDCIISGNSGRGFQCEGSSATLTNCTISGNSVGGVVCFSSSPRLSRCTISRNSGNGVSCFSSSSPTLTGCTISGNSASWGGGFESVGRGVLCWNESSPMLTACTISENTGGGVLCETASSPMLTNCTISGNSGTYDGGGLHCLTDSSPALINCTISGNSAYYGGGVHCQINCSPTLMNCTITGNLDKFDSKMGGVLCSVDSSPTLTNCIIWENAGQGIEKDASSNPLVSYSIVQNSLWFGNCDQDPLFVGPGDYRLRSGSPCIDAGTPEGAPTIDIENNPRPCGKRVDIGAHEYCGDSPPDRIPMFHRGDTDSSGATDITDGIVLLGFLYLGAPAALPCKESADVDNDGTIELTDVIYLLNWLFLGGPEPAAPGPVGAPCGIDPDPSGSPGDLGCEVYTGCCQ